MAKHQLNLKDMREIISMTLAEFCYSPRHMTGVVTEEVSFTFIDITKANEKTFDATEKLNVVSVEPTKEDE